MLRIGLTGGIGTGKSTVAQLFARRGVPVIDADEIAHAIVVPGLPAHAEIVDAFGPGILDDKGNIDRARLREQVFADSRARKRLEAILHPRIREAMARRGREIKAPYCLMVIPLLVETRQDADVDRVLVVDAPEELQLARVAARSGLTEEAARKIIAAQASRETRLARADDTILNDGDLAQLEQAVERLHRLYLTLSEPGRRPPGRS